MPIPLTLDPSSTPPSPDQLQDIKAQLDLILLALEALTGLGSEAMLQAAEVLGLSQVL
ncbi:MAG: DUF3038 domain-containing protein, partial [Cyanobacteria bacterium P01_A01_bin.135]